MASDNPTGGERAVPLSIPAAQARYLRRELAGFKAGLEDDLKSHPAHPRAGRWRADAEAYGRLVDGLDAGAILPDARVVGLVREWAEARDGAEHYEQVAFEHEALLALRVQIGAGR